MVTPSEVSGLDDGTVLVHAISMRMLHVLHPPARTCSGHALLKQLTRLRQSSKEWLSGTREEHAHHRRCCPLTAAEVERSLKFILTMVADSKNRHSIRIDIEMKNNSVRWAGTDAE